ncbi:hypothetical protein Dimus_026849, partial [Dionaea muscipula]
IWKDHSSPTRPRRCKVLCTDGGCRSCPAIVAAVRCCLVSMVDVELNFDMDEFFDFPAEGIYELGWVSKIHDLDEDLNWAAVERKHREHWHWS